MQTIQTHLNLKYVSTLRYQRLHRSEQLTESLALVIERGSEHEHHHLAVAAQKALSEHYIVVRRPPQMMRPVQLLTYISHIDIAQGSGLAASVFDLED